MKFPRLFFCFAAFTAVLSLSTCRVDDSVIDLEGSQYPTEIGKLMLTKCAVAGCHNNISKEGASGLSLQTWEDMFKGTRNGAAVIPYNHQLSTLFLYTNHFTDLGLGNTPTMPIGKEPLTREEVLMLRDWINKGAPRRDGFVKFSDNPSRSKFYVTNQGCDLVLVFDAESGLPMRAISVGVSEAIESPHQVRVSPDGKYWYVIFINGQYIQKFRCSDDAYIGKVFIGQGSWNTLQITKDGKHAFALDFSYNQSRNLVYVDLEKMELQLSYGGVNYDYPHGQVIDNQDTLYILSQLNNTFYKLDVSDPVGNTDVGSAKPFSGIGASPQLEAHDIRYTPDGSKYFVTCQKTSEVRVYQANTDMLLAVIPVGTFPQELCFSESTPYVFVTCMEDGVTFPGAVGSVAVIDYHTNTLVKSIYTGTQPHGIAVDDKKGLVYVANRNVTTAGPAPHHSSLCGGRNGTVSVIDMKSLTLLPRKVEVSVDPYFVDIRK